jgi:hypothetical protein
MDMTMKPVWIVSLAIFLLLSCCPLNQLDFIGQEFYSDLASENNRISGELYLDVFGGSLDTLRYEYYINYLNGHEAPSAEGLTKRIQLADKNAFRTKKSAFLLGLEYDQAHVICVDNSGTSFLDTVIVWKEGERGPLLEEVMARMRF